jgi:hypothetical protein
MTREWQQGFEIDRLKGIAAVFRARHKALVFGAFGLTKERDIADALASDTLAWKGPADAPTAVAILHKLKVAGGFTDFAQRAIEIPAGHVKVSAFAALDAASGTAVLSAISARTPRQLWVEVFEEDIIARECLAAVPALRYRATKITAGAEVKGIYSDAVAQEGERRLHPAHAASLVELDPAFALADERAAMLAEVDQFAAWEQHYSSYNKRKSWTAFALRGFDANDPTFIVKPAEMAKAWKAENPLRLSARPAWTSACGRFPRTMACVERILEGREADRVRLMRLTPGGELSRHADITDRDAGLADGFLARLHLPLRTSPAVIFHGWDKRGGHIETRFREGALCYLDQRGPHRVENRDPTVERVHLVVDVKSDEAIRERIAAAMVQ